MRNEGAEIVCLDAGEDDVQLCKWDGVEIRIERAAAPDVTAAISQALDKLVPRPGFRLRYRIAEGVPDSEVMARWIEGVGRSLGVGAIRRLPDDVRAEPGLTAARQAADRHRLGEIVCLELRRGSYICAAVDARGRAGTHERGKWADADAVGAVVKRFGRAGSTLTCYGCAVSEAKAIEIARRFGLRHVLVPDYAASFAVVGMLIVDLVFELRADPPKDSADTRGIRESFARLMDEAARQVTLEGYDIDDTVCERLVEMAGGEGILLEGLTGPSKEIRGLFLRVTIHTPKFALPADGTGRLISIG
ncbi:MAG TPA: hypothetical protein VJZ71_16105 [Phycisphaerae bacterium]|nr:hypothetical protein [Phycisphaerae bacterium]